MGAERPTARAGGERAGASERPAAVTRRRLFEAAVLSTGGVASAAFALPALGFALGPMFEDQTAVSWQDVGAEEQFDSRTYVPRVISLVPGVGESGKTTIYLRRFDPERDDPRNQDLPYVACSTRCTHLGCPVRYTAASERFICPCHGGVYGFDGSVVGGPPVRPLDRFHTRVRRGRVEVGERFSLNSKFERFSPRDPANHLDGLWQYLYPARPST